MLEKGLIVNSLLETYKLPLSKQREGKEVLIFLVLVSKFNLNNFERAIKKFKASIRVKI